MKEGMLDGYSRPVKQEDALSSSLSHDIWEWKFSTIQHKTIDRAVAKWLILDKHHVQAV